MGDLFDAKRDEVDEALKDLTEDQGKEIENAIDKQQSELDQKLEESLKKLRKTSS
jgi:hypothetical protein